MTKLSADDYYYNPETSGNSFEERTGDPDSFSAGIGRIVLNFSELESQLSAGIVKCLNLEQSLGRIITSEISFGVKVHMLSSLVRHLASERKFNVGIDEPLSCWAKISAQCFRAEEMRNQVMHSEWSGPYLRDLKAVRRKFTAKASRGLSEHTEPVTSGGSRKGSRNH